MSSYLATNYKGKYNMQAEIDKRTGDFCRDEKGDLDNFSDVWIECQGKGRIYYYGKGIMQFYCPSLGRGHNILKSLYIELLKHSTDKFVIDNRFDYESMYNELKTNKAIFDIEETDEEVLFKFKANNLEKLEHILKPKSTCLWSPYSVKYLRRNAVKENGKYVINSADLSSYKEITNVIPKGEMRMYVDINNAFIAQISTKNHKADVIKNEIKVGGFGKTYEYFNSLGQDIWDKYLKFLKENIEKKLKEIK